MKHLLVVTHPEATHHVEDRVGGWHDSSLTPRGREQAARISARLRELIPPEVVVEIHTSDLRRCQETAKLIDQVFGVSSRPNADLREISYGEAEGQPQAWLDARFVFPPCEGDRLDHDFGIASAETRRDVAERLYRAMNTILASPAEHQVIVTHGFALTFVVAAWIGMPLESAGMIGLPVSSGSITTLRQEPPFYNRSIVTLNDTAHLGR